MPALNPCDLYDVRSMLSEEERAEVSFTTGLRISPRRPFQLHAVPLDPVLLRQLQRNEQAVVIQLPNLSDPLARDTKSTSTTL